MPTPTRTPPSCTASAAPPVGTSLSLASLARSIQPFVSAVAHKLVVNPADAEEIAQEVWVVIVRNMDRFEGRSSMETWVYALVRSQVSHRFRRARPVPLSSIDVQVDEPDDPRDDMARWELHDDIEQALADLSELDRTIVLERDLDGYCAQDVADHVGLSVPALKSRLRRARVAMRQRLASTHVHAAA